jgi:3-phosphoshikimate 1-carboxyvinyltransferase
MRLLSGILSAQPFHSVVGGDASLSKRPMNRIIQPLSLMGADIHSKKGGFPPLQIRGTTLRPIHYVSPVASAQIKSCVLLAGLFAAGTTAVTEPQLSRDHSERMLPCFGIPVEKDGLTVSVTGPAKLRSASIDVPGDISSAAFYIIAAMLIKNSNLTLKNIGINPTRSGLIDVLKQMGAKIQKSNVSDANGEPRADLTVINNKLRGTEINSKYIPLLIDEIPILAIAAARAEGTTIIRDAKELRVKESDRIDAIGKNLKAMGVEIETFEDGFSITGPQSLKGAKIDSFGDHRIAMAFSIAGLLAEGETVIHNSECAQISYPAFFETLKKISNG